MTENRVIPIRSNVARRIAAECHYLHRKPPTTFAYGLESGGVLMGILTLGVPPSRHLQKSACPTRPDLVIELNRLWVDDRMPRNTESWFIARALKLMPSLLVVSYADTSYGHSGFVYRAANFDYAGWTDMERKTPRLDYVPSSGGHSRDAFRGGFVEKVRRVAKVKYWTVTGSTREKKALRLIAGWPSLSWKALPSPLPPEEGTARHEVA